MHQDTKFTANSPVPDIVADINSKKESCLEMVQKPIKRLFRKAYQIFYGESTEMQNTKNKSKFSNELNSIFLKRKSTALRESFYDDDDDGSVLPALLSLPVKVRKSIYDIVDYGDILSLRLTCKMLTSDIDSLHGVSVRTHEGRLDYEQPLQNLSIGKLNIEQLFRDNLNQTVMFPRPAVLRKLFISGSISEANMDFLLQIACNLAEMRLEFHFYEQLIPTGHYLSSRPIRSLNVLEILCSASSEISESPSVFNSIQDFLVAIECPSLSKFKFYLDGLVSNRMQQYHGFVQKFIGRNGSIRSIDAQFRQLGHNATDAMSAEDINLADDSDDAGPQISVLRLNTNNNARLWYALLDSQRNLRSLDLQLNGLTWNRLILALDKNALNLTSLKVKDLCSTRQNGTPTVPVDFGLLRNLKSLENLEIHHNDLESRGLESPPVFRTSTLPESLRTIKLGHLGLKPHQAMFMLVKLPRLEKLELMCWSDSESSLTSYLHIVTFIIKFDITPVRSLVLTDSRRRMENQQLVVNRMIKTLSDAAQIILTNTELYSQLEIIRLI